jgi:hypothetical protein
VKTEIPLNHQMKKERKMMRFVGIAVLLGALLPIAPAANKTMAQQSFHVNRVQLSMLPTTLKTWKCGDYIQVVYHAKFNVSSGPSGGTMRFSWTINNGRAQTNAQLTILPGQKHSDYTFTWQGALPADHTQPGVAIVLVTAPNIVKSTSVYQAAGCRL